MSVIGEYTSRISPPAGRHTVGSNIGLATAPAQAVAGMGAEITETAKGILFDIQNAQKALEYSSFEGKEQEYRDAAINAINIPEFDINNEQAVAQIKQKVDSDRTALSSKFPQVNNLYKQLLKKTSPNWDKVFQAEVNNVKARKVTADFNFNYDELLEKGNVFGAYKLLNHMLKTGVITQPEYEYRKKNAPADSVIAQSRILIGNNNPQAAIEMLEGLKGLSGEQLDRRDSLLRLAQQTQTSMSDAFGKSILKDMYEADKKPLTPMQRSETADGMRSKVLDPNNGLSIAESRTLMSDIDKWEKGEFEHNPEVYWPLLRRVTADPKGVTEQEIAKLVGKGLTTKDYTELNRIREAKDEPLKTPRAQLYFNSLDALYDERETDAEQRVKYDIANEKLMQFFTDNPKATVKQAAEFYDELVSPAVLSLFDRFGKMLRPKESTPFWRHFGTTEEAALAREKTKKEPGSIKEFNDMVSSIEDEEEAKKYYEKWKDKW